jgi:hypothetical protein
LNHPWFCSSTPGEQVLERSLACLPPSPSTLAQPIRSPSFIDPELLASLKVIWGRHSDSDGQVIKRDLCSPAGNGTYAKAFYYLLGKHREQAREEDVTSPACADGSDIVLIDRQLLTTGACDTTRHCSRSSGMITTSGLHVENSITQSRPSCLPIIRRSSVFGSADPSIIRERPSSPIGPRPPPTGTCGSEFWRKQSDAIERRLAKASMHQSKPLYGPVEDIAIRPHSLRRGNTYSHPDTDSPAVQPPLFFPEPPTKTKRPKSVIGPTNPKKNTRSKARTSYDGGVYSFQFLEANRGCFESIQNASNKAATNLIAKPISTATAGSRCEHRITGAPAFENKENKSANDDSWIQLSKDEQEVRGVGLGMSREVGRNIGNVMSTIENGVSLRPTGKKERKTRRRFLFSSLGFY